MLNVKGNSRNDYIRIRLTVEEKDLIKVAASKKGLTITDYIKVCVNKEMKRSREVE